MNPNEESVILNIGARSDQVKSALDEVVHKTKTTNERLKTINRKAGRDAGNAFGQELNNATKKWLTAAEDMLRTYGGVAGNILGNILKGFRGLSEAREASAKEAANQGSSGFGSSLAANVGGDYLGSYAGAKKGVAAGGGYGKEFQAQTAQFHKTVEEDVAATLAEVKPATEEVSKALASTGKFADRAKLGFLGLVGGVAIAAAAIKYFATAWGEAYKQIKEQGIAAQTAKDIGKLKTVSERYKAAIDQFGTLAKFDEAKESIKDYEKQFTGFSGLLNRYLFTAKAGWDRLKEGIDLVTDSKGFKTIFGALANQFAGKTGIHLIDALSLKDSLDSAVRLEVLQRKFVESEKRKEERQKKAAEEKQKKLEDEKQAEQKISDLLEQRYKDNASKQDLLKTQQEDLAKLERTRTNSMQDYYNWLKKSAEVADTLKAISEDEAKAKEKAAEAAKEEATNSIDGANKYRISLSELAGSGVNNFATQRANEIQAREKDVIKLNAQGRFADADKLRKQIEFEKSRLVGMGILKTTELDIGPGGLDANQQAGFAAGDPNAGLTPDQIARKNYMDNIHNQREARMQHLRNMRNPMNYKHVQLSNDNQGLLEWIKQGNPVPVKAINSK